MSSFFHSSSPLIIAIVLAGALIAAGCDGCGESKKETPGVDAVEAPMGNELVAVARFADFDMRHFDIQHWWAEAVQIGRLTGRDDAPGGIAPKPTNELRKFSDEVLADTSFDIEWARGVDVAIWKPESGSERWRWAYSLGVDSGESAGPRTEEGWKNEGRYGLEAEEETTFEVFSRSEDDGETFYVAMIDEATVTVSNTPTGGLHLDEALELTGESGVEEAELYLWPRRLGVGERYAAIAERLDQKLASSGHGKTPVISAIEQLQTRLVRAAGDDGAWPEVVRLWLEIERDEETRGAEKVELKIDVPIEQSAVIGGLGEAFGTEEEQNGEAIPLARHDDARGQLQIDFEIPGFLRFIHTTLPHAWRYAANIRPPEEQEAFVQSFGRLISHSAGPSVVAFFGSQVPTGMTADMYVAWATDHDERIADDVREFHRRLMRDIWMPLFRIDEFARREKTEIEVEGEELEAEQKTLQIGHGHGELGACWTVKGDQFLSYYGVMPCDRLEDVIARSEGEAEFGAPLSYTGELRRLVEVLYLAPGARLDRDVFSGIDADVNITWPTEEHLRLTATFTDLPQLAQVVDAAPRLASWWDRESMFHSEMPEDSLSVGITRFQEPGFAAIAAPGMAGAFPASLLLGIPFSHPPTMPSLYQTLFFADPDQDDHHHHHHHHHHH